MGQIDTSTMVQMLVPESTRENYAREIRRDAIARGVSVLDAAGAWVERWRKMHESDVLSGFNHLANWVEDAIRQGSQDLGEYLNGQVDPVEAQKVRDLETAKRDPQQGAVLLDHTDPAIQSEILAARGQAGAADSTVAPVVTPDGDVVQDLGTSTDGTVDTSTVATAPPVDATAQDDVPPSSDSSTPATKAPRASKAATASK